MQTHISSCKPPVSCANFGFALKMRESKGSSFMQWRIKTTTTFFIINNNNTNNNEV